MKYVTRFRCLAGGWLLLLLLAGRAWALDPTKSIYQYNCQNWTRQTALPENEIKCVVQSRDGYIWLGTQNGLIRFDGLEFKAVPIDLPEAQGQEIRQMIASQAGGIRFAITGGGYGSFDGKKFSPLGDERWWQQDLNGTSVLEARDGAIWTGCNRGIGRWVSGDTNASFLNETSSPAFALSMAEDSKGRIFMGTAMRGLFYWVNGKFYSFHDELLKNEFIAALAVDAEDQLWVGTSHGLSCYAAGQPKEIPVLSNEIKALLVDRHGVLWVGTTGSGLVRYQNGQYTFLKKADGLVSDNITSLFEDAEGSLWVGTEDGLSQLTDLKFPIYSDHEGLVGGSAHGVCASRNGGFWISTASGVSYFNNGQVTNYTQGAPLYTAFHKLGFEARNGDYYVLDGERRILVLAGGKITACYSNLEWPDSFAEDGHGILAGVGKVLCRIENGAVQPFEYKETPPEYYWIRDIFVASDGAIWIGSNNGLYRIKDGIYKQWPTMAGFAGTRVMWIMEDEDHSIWAGSAAGIARIKDGQLVNIAEENGLPDHTIYAIVPDDRGYFWVDSGRGIFRVTHKSLIDCADGRTNRVECDAYDGLESVKFNDRTDQDSSGCRTLDGRIWFPNPQGVVMIDPAHFFTNRIAPPVYLDEIKVDGVELKDRGDGSLRSRIGRVEFFFSALSYIAPKKTRIRYVLEGYDTGWIEAGSQRSVLYNKLPLGKYVFRVQACNADGVWNSKDASFSLEVPPAYYQTVWFMGLCGLAGVLGLFGFYRWNVGHMQARQLKLQAENELLEQKVGRRTAQLAESNSSLQTEIEHHKLTELELKQRTLSLESEIEQRKRLQVEAEQTHKELMDASRQAGMAEVATNVLHNVGNVLNSVNVSASVVMGSVKKSRLGNLEKVAGLLREHEADLGDFITRTPQGKQLPGYIAMLSSHLLAEQEQTLKELDSLRGNVEHIKEIVAMQQSYAKVSGVMEIVNLRKLVEDSLNMNLGSLSRHGVTVIREFAEVPPVNVEKHKILQILINLVRNAKQACDASDRQDKQVTVRLAATGDRVSISVADNGVGISPENLTRIFNHGFTTKKNGHGFGLHSGALAAKEMGGSLTAHSDGSGKGACFVIELPLRT